MKNLRLRGGPLAPVLVVVPILLLFVYVALRSGPLAPIAVTVASVGTRPLVPALAGIGTVQSRYAYRIGPTVAGRLHRLEVDVGDEVTAGQALGEMDPVDLDERARAQQAGISSAEANRQEAQARQTYAQTQARRYDQLLAMRNVSEETVVTKRQELAVADAVLRAAHEDVRRLRSDLGALRAQRDNLKLTSPVAGLVVARNADPGTTVVAGQAVIEVIEPASLWIDARFDQVSAQGLAAHLPAQIVLRSRPDQTLPGSVLRVEPLADAVTEESKAKIIFDAIPSPLPPVGELAEVTVQLAALPAAPTVPNAAIHTVDGMRGVWMLAGDELQFTPVTLGRSSLDGDVQITAGLSSGDRIVVYSEKALTARSRIRVVDRIPGTPP